MPSFDVVSDIDAHELTNAVDQANRELQQRFDFKDTGATFELKAKEFTIVVKAEVEFQLKQMLEILKIRLAKRGIDVACLEIKDANTNLAEAKQDVVLRHGIDADCGRCASDLGRVLAGTGSGHRPAHSRRSRRIQVRSGVSAVDTV